MFRPLFAVFLLSTPALAQETKEESCGYQADVVRAIQQARLDRVKEADIAETIASTNPTWPANYNAAIPQLTSWVYEQKKRDLRKKDLGGILYEQCVDNWEQIQALKNKLNN
ncbi:hypothetical protein [uncultured Ruegeria sp.]|uniref:hypothetical protein n=1 Tax=uncultured Ruegeria sp. TaxID=259304 RepID=UPI0026230500|nr:hypothetical protein [uncultured Ruegeria sp.]